MYCSSLPLYLELCVESEEGAAGAVNEGEGLHSSGAAAAVRTAYYCVERAEGAAGAVDEPVPAPRAACWGRALRCRLVSQLSDEPALAFRHWPLPPHAFHCVQRETLLTWMT